MKQNDNEEGVFSENLQLDHYVPEIVPPPDQTHVEEVRIGEVHPVEQKTIKNNALEFDIKLGWMPRSQITGPIPLAYSSPLTQTILHKELQSIIYLGYRPTNTFHIHEHFYQNGEKYPFNQFHLCKTQFLQRFFKQYYSDFTFDNERKVGMVTENSLIFDSQFEGGNLDVVYWKNGVYCCLLRVDTNTRGHCNYYNFRYEIGCIQHRVKNKQKGKYIFHIQNMSKPKSLYERGKMPFVRVGGGEWQQSGSKVRYGESVLNEENQLPKKMYSLRFQYQFTTVNEWVSFCYGIPFVYSDLLALLNSYRSHPHFYLHKLCYSLSGVEIPLVTITQPSQTEGQSEEGNDKTVIMISGRVHPGETHGSHIINGFMKSLLSDRLEANMIRKNIIVKIVPMINPDGVIIGNTRTSFAGKDLNRVYGNKIDFVFPEIIGVRDYVQKLKNKYGSKFLFFIDVHGHSTRKNSFFYGPEFPVFDEEYHKCRMLPKIYSTKTDIFRYYSCKFRIATNREKTCRGYMNNKHIVRTYTHQTSMHCFFDFKERKDKPFNRIILEEFGEKLMEAIYQYLLAAIKMKPITIEEPAKIPKKKKKVVKKKQNKPVKEEEKQLPQQEEEVQEYEEDSDQMDSAGADSQDSGQDFGFNYMKMFYNRINANREYFYEELMQMNGMPVQHKKIKSLSHKPKSPSQDAKKQQTPAIVTPSIETQNSQHLFKKKKISIIPKLQNSQRKKYNFVEYDKISSVVFGGTSSNFPHLDPHNSNKPRVLEKKYNKYSFVTIAPFEERKPEMNQIKFRNQDHTRTLQKDQELTEEEKSKESNLRERAHQRYQSLPARHGLKNEELEMKNYSIKPNLLDRKSIEQLIAPNKALYFVHEEPSYTIANQSRKFYDNKKQSTKTMFDTSKNKFLSRKKSIKNFKEEQEHKKQKKIGKSMKETGLIKKLPSLSKLSNKY